MGRGASRAVFFPFALLTELEETRSGRSQTV